ncbi:MAG TPA: DUF6167 family protein [Nocardioides sp.]|nr:DUF6167 family protein [Nocardioides sp.]
MIGRGVWFAAGAAAGVYATVKARRVAEAFTPDGIRDRIGAVGLGARMMREEFAQGAADAEAGLRQRYTAAAEERRALEPGRDTPSGYSTTDERK